ncbi:Radical SAM domain protein [Chloroherpeton thalassium ATCC 35110]|uniref:Radical SAM domain protein n=1 Tax=Chloroherpeton thalassium (strain ATCC 35110 / GB-78) TaxID=517418 RepID=B3QSV5_CHLT3|nr:radical SAM domain-containing protein [Chloroherpeton thalassium]ACF12598.1 Radical SAM domain protein [Chloroherpeton thalassium ATCC 35110]
MQDETMLRTDERAEAAFELRKANFPNEIVFHTPGLKQYQTSEYTKHNSREFVAVSLTGTDCALNCKHCGKVLLRGMLNLKKFQGSLFEMCRKLSEDGAKGVLISGGSDRAGSVPLLKFIPDLARVKKELGLTVRVHPGLIDDETCSALREANIDGVMFDVIGDRQTIREVYGLEKEPEDYEAVLARLEKYELPCVPHVVIGHYFGKLKGELNALEMVRRHPPKMLVLVVLMAVAGTEMAEIAPPTIQDIEEIFFAARTMLPETLIGLGCARPIGEVKKQIDRSAIDMGLNSIAYPTEGMVKYAESKGLQARFINACCGVNW